MSAKRSSVRSCSRDSARRSSKSVEKRNDAGRDGKGKETETAARTKKLANATTMMSQDEVEIESGHWCAMLVNESQNHDKMTEKAGSRNGAVVRKLVKDICR